MPVFIGVFKVWPTVWGVYLSFFHVRPYLGNQYVGTANYSCAQVGHNFKGIERVQATPNPSFHRVDEIITDGNGQQLLTISTVVGRW